MANQRSTKGFQNYKVFHIFKILLQLIQDQILEKIQTISPLNCLWRLMKDYFLKL